MKKAIKWIVNHPKTVIGLYGILIVVSALLSLGVGTNYNMVTYLPEDMGSKAAITILEDEFGLHGSANILIEAKRIPDVLQIKNQVQAVSGVRQVIWLDDLVDIKQPLEFLDQETVRAYYAEDYAFMQVVFDEDDYAKSTTQAIEDINNIIGEIGGMAGPAVTASSLATGLGGNMLKILIMVIPIVLFILIVSTSSYFEVILFLVTIGVAIIINEGTNIIFGEISFITASASSMLQLAIAMDYSIFLLHRFAEEHNKSSDAREAMSISLKTSFATISSSAVTTMAGFMALTLMSFTIGRDLGFVLAKGIFISLICVMTLLPALTVITDKWVQKTKHKEFLPSFRGMAKLFEKGRFVIVGIIIVITIPAFLAQRHIPLAFSSESAQDNQSIKAIEEKIVDVFGKKNTLLVLVPKDFPVNEFNMAKDIKALEEVNQLQGVYAFIDPTMSLILLPDQMIEQFNSKNYSRYVINLVTAVESDEAFRVLDEIKSIIGSYYDQYYITGMTASTADTKAVSERDITIITIVSILAVGLVLVITFKSLAAPLLMILVIEIAIWVNMSIPYFAGTQMNYVGFLIVSALQLGATIDYAILLSNRYIENRHTMKKEIASIEAVTKAGHSIFTSSSILGTAGLSMYFLFDEATLQSMGLLIGRGALISGFCVIVVLPQILLILDPVIMRKQRKLERLEKGV